MLEALQACAGRGAARPVCALAAASFRAATLLGMTCAEAARLGPRQSLQILLMKGPAAAPVRCCNLRHLLVYLDPVVVHGDHLSDRAGHGRDRFVQMLRHFLCLYQSTRARLP